MIKFIKKIYKLANDFNKEIIILIIVGIFIYFSFSLANYFRNKVDNYFSLENHLIGGLDMHIEIIPPDMNDEQQTLNIQVNSINFNSWNLDQRITKVCIREFDFLFYGYSTYISPPYENHPFSFDSELCGQLKSDTWNNNIPSKNSLIYDIEANQKKISDYLYVENNPFFYPFDWFILQVASIGMVEYYDKNDNIMSEEPMQISLYANISSDEWEAAADDTTSPYFWEYWINGLKDDREIGIIQDYYAPMILSKLQSPKIITIARPIYLRVILPIIIITLLIFIIILSITDSLETFLAGSLAILFGVFTTRSVFLNEVSNTKTIIDVLLIGVYVSFAIAVIFQGSKFIDKELFAGYLLRKKKNNHRIAEFSSLQKKNRKYTGRRLILRTNLIHKKNTDKRDDL